MLQKKEKKRNRIYPAYAVIALIIMVQLVDSYCTGLYDKLQSMSVRTFIMDVKGMEPDAAVAYMSRMMLPFYVIGMLTPFVRALADIIGRRVMLIMDVLLLMLGSALCMTADRLVLYLLGNGILILGYSLDIHMIYIVDVVERKRRATVRGICGGVSMAAAMCIPLMRYMYVDRQGCTWQSLYMAGAVGAAICLAAVLSGSSSKASVPVRSCEADKPESTHFLRTAGRLVTDKRTGRLLVCICIAGISTAGITYYNEPMLAFSDMDEAGVNTALLVQPVTALIINVVTGAAADRLGRGRVIIAGIALSLACGCVYTIGVGHIESAAALGVLWGCMSGFYFSSEELINLMVMESVDESRRGRASAMSTLAYGIGDNIGILAISLIVGATGMRLAKLIFLAPLLAAGIYAVSSHCCDEASEAP